MLIFRLDLHSVLPRRSYRLFHHSRGGTHSLRQEFDVTPPNIPVCAHPRTVNASSSEIGCCPCGHWSALKCEWKCIKSCVECDPMPYERVGGRGKCVYLLLWIFGQLRPQSSPCRPCSGVPATPLGGQAASEIFIVCRVLIALWQSQAMQNVDDEYAFLSGALTPHTHC